jgi:uncharacterized protein (DUF488 family)
MLYTLGHSTRTIEEFLEILEKFQIELVVDVRKFPSSKKFPWFNKENLEKILPDKNIKYIHFAELGGYRKEGYENFSKTEEFRKAVEKLLEITGSRNTIILCSEMVWFRCHRKYIAKAIVDRGFSVTHIYNKEKVQLHEKSKEIDEKMKLVLFCDKKAKKLKESTLP